MAKVLSSISGNLISAASAGYAPTNSADVSAIASGFQVVSATGTQTYAGTAYVTSLNSAPISAERAGNAANAVMANSAYYDGTGRLISALPDSAAVSSIASAYVSGKQDSLTFAYDADNAISSINGSALAGGGGGAVVTATASGDYYDYRPGRLGYYTGISGLNNSSLVANFATVTDYARYDSRTRELSSLASEEYVDSSISGKQDSSAMSAYALSADVSGCIDTVSSNSASWASSIATASATAYKQNGTQLVTFTGVVSADSKPLIAQTIQAGAVQSIGTSNFFYGPSAKPFTANTAGIYAPLQYATGACLAMDGGTYRAYYKGNEWFISDYGTNRSGAVRAEVHNTRGIHISGSNTAGVGFDLLTSGLNFTNNTGTTSMTPANIAEWKSCNSTVSANSATWGETAYIPLSSTSIEMTSTAYSATYGLESIDLFVKGVDSSNVVIEPAGISFKSGNGTNIGFVDPYHIGNWDGVYNTVSDQSANWGRFNETILWEGSARVTSYSSNLSESLHNFRYVDIYVQPNSADVKKRANQIKRFEVLNAGETAELYFPRSESMENYNAISEVFYVWAYNNGADFTLKNGARWSGDNYVSSVTAYRGMVTKIVGIGRI